MIFGDNLALVRRDEPPFVFAFIENLILRFWVSGDSAIWIFMNLLPETFHVFHVIFNCNTLRGYNRFFA